jgi:hypothetical protein
MNNSFDDGGIETEHVRLHLVTMMDDFINQILKIRRTLLGVSLSALILAPVAIVLSLFLLRHHTFFAVLEVENEFGIVLSILLLLIVIISTMWIIAGIKQYHSIGRTWSKKFKAYQKHKEEADRKIAEQYGIGT